MCFRVGTNLSDVIRANKRTRVEAHTGTFFLLPCKRQPQYSSRTSQHCCRTVHEFEISAQRILLSNTNPESRSNFGAFVSGSSLCRPRHDLLARFYSHFLLLVLSGIVSFECKAKSTSIHLGWVEGHFHCMTATFSFADNVETVFALHNICLAGPTDLLNIDLNSLNE